MERKQELKRIIKSLISDIHKSSESINYRDLDSILEDANKKQDLNDTIHNSMLLDRYLDEYKQL